MWTFKKRPEHIGLEGLSEFLDGRASVSRLEHIEGHLSSCDLCKEELNSLEYAVGLLQQAPMLAPRRRLAIQQVRTAAPRWNAKAPLWAYGSAASVAVALAVMVVWADLGGALSGGAEHPGIAGQTESDPARSSSAQPDITYETSAVAEIAGTPSFASPTSMSDGRIIYEGLETELEDVRTPVEGDIMADSPIIEGGVDHGDDGEIEKSQESGPALLTLTEAKASDAMDGGGVADDDGGIAVLSWALGAVLGGVAALLWAALLWRTLYLRRRTPGSG